MSKIRITNCINDHVTTTNPIVRANYVTAHGGGRLQSRVVDSISCRQMYLRSYTFSRKETMPERTMKCLVKVRERVAAAGRKEKGAERKLMRRRVVKEFSCAAVYAVFRRVLFCTTTM